LSSSPEFFLKQKTKKNQSRTHQISPAVVNWDLGVGTSLLYDSERARCKENTKLTVRKRKVKKEMLIEK
jgi:hypothetical protein